MSTPPTSPGDASIVEMVVCPDCGHQVPEPNMEIHRAHACQAQKPRDRSPIDVEMMDADSDTDDEAVHTNAAAAAAAGSYPDDETAQDDWVRSRLREGRRNADNIAAASSSVPAYNPEATSSEWIPSRPFLPRASWEMSPTTTTRSTARPSVPPADLDDSSNNNNNIPSPPFSTPERVPAVASMPAPDSAGSDGSSPWDNLTSSWRRWTQRGDEEEDERKPKATATAARGKSTRRNNSNGGIIQVGDVVDLVDDDDDDKSNEGWACPRCTLINPAERHNCDACSFVRPGNENQSTRAPDPVRRERLVNPPPGAAESPPSPAMYLSGGALLGGVVGAASAYARGRPVTSGALEGAVSGAVGGAVVQEVVQANNTAQAARDAGRSYRSNNSNNNNSDGMQTRRRSDQQPGRVRVVRRRGPDGRTTITTVMGSSNGSGMGGMSGDPMLDMMMMQALMAGPGRRSGQRGANVDGMSYEQLLQAFGDGTENLGAGEGQIRSMPTSTVQDPSQLPADARQCAICLENFVTGDTRKTLPCLHAFHGTCIDKWLRTNGACPICKHRLGR